MKISVVLPFYIINEHLEQLTEECLMSIAGQFDELVAVDNGSNLYFCVGDLQADVYIRFEQNTGGIVKACNAGIAAASGDYIILVTNDTRLEKGNLKDLCGEGYCFPKITNIQGPPWNGAFYGFPRKLGGLKDERYTMFYDDVDLFYDAAKRRIPMSYVESVKVFHHHGQTTKTDKSREGLMKKDHKKFVEKWHVNPEIDFNNFIQW